MQILIKTLSRNFNRQLLRREIKQQFPAKFKVIDLGGFEVDESLFTTGSIIPKRIVKPRTAPHTVSKTLDSEDIYQPAELRIRFEPDLTAPEQTTLDSLLASHDELQTTPRQNAEDTDDTTLDDIDAFLNGQPFNARNNPDQNQHIRDIDRMILRIWKRLQAAE